MHINAERQRAILDAAMELFEKHTLKDITLDRLSKVSGVSAFDIIREFQSSDMILKAVLERELELMAAAAREPQLRMPGETMEDELRMLAGVILDQYRRRIAFMGKMLDEARHDPEVAGLYYQTFVVRGRRLFAEFLGARAEYGDLADGVDVEAAAAMFLAALLGSVMTFELFGGIQVESLDEERLLCQMCRTFVSGVAVRRRAA
jgi:AcrR family transcriptional regulator